MSTAAETDPQGLLGRSRAHESLKDYKSPDHYTDQGETRVVKDLMFTYHQMAPNPMSPGLGDIVVEKIGKRGEVVHVDELGTQALEKGERLGSFFTSEELAKLRPEQVRQIWLGGVPPDEVKKQVGVAANVSVPVDEEGTPDFTEWGAHELADYIEQNKTNVSETVAMAGDDPEAAKRVLEAENIVTGNDPRTGVTQGLARIIGES